MVEFQKQQCFGNSHSQVFLVFAVTPSDFFFICAVDSRDRAEEASG